MTGVRMGEKGKKIKGEMNGKKLNRKNAQQSDRDRSFMSCYGILPFPEGNGKSRSDFKAEVT